MRSTRLVAFSAGAATFGVLAVGGCAEHVANSVSAAHAVVAASVAHSRNSVHLTAYTDNDGPTETVIVTGAVGDYGKAVSVYPNGAVDPDHTSQLSLQLSRGTLRLDTAALDQAFVAAIRNDFPSNTTTCSGMVEVTRQVPVVAGSGTGAYKGIGGSFTLTATLDEVDKASTAQPCSASSAFLNQAILVTGPGTMTF
jgi:hypothetical protein